MTAGQADLGLRSCCNLGPASPVGARKGGLSDGTPASGRHRQIALGLHPSDAFRGLANLDQRHMALGHIQAIRARVEPIDVPEEALGFLDLAIADVFMRGEDGARHAPSSRIAWFAPSAQHRRYSLERHPGAGYPRESMSARYPGCV